MRIPRRFLVIALWMAVFTQASAPAQQKSIKDTAEYNAYIAALNTQDPVAKAAAMEAFIAQYPNSIVKVEGMEQAMAAYQQSNNAEKVSEMANRILAVDAGNVRALAIVVYFQRYKLTQKADSQSLKDLRANCEKGLQSLSTWSKPDEVSEADFNKLKSQMSVIFEGGVAFGAMQTKDYSIARDHYLKAVAIDPGDISNMYQLSIAELEMTPMDLNGFWHVARAMQLLKAQNNTAGAQSVEQYAKAKYRKYHGSNDGWEAVTAQAATQSAPPPGFAASIKPAPTACELAVNAVKENEPSQLSFGDYEFILEHKDCSAENGAAAQKIWNFIQGMQKNGTVKMKINVRVISSTDRTLAAAITDESWEKQHTDLFVMFDSALPSAPAPGTQLDVVGLITEYKATPFSFTMEHAELPKK